MSGYVGIPSYYTPVEYLEGGDTQYIDTGVAMPNGYKAIGGVAFTAVDGQWHAIVGTENSTTPYGQNLIRINMSNYWCVEDIASSTKPTANTYYEFEGCTMNANCYLKVNSAYVVASTTRTTTLFNKNLFVFANNQNGSVVQFGKIRLYYLKLYDENDNLVRDYIPVVDSNGVACMYDKVGEKFYFNKGTGVFTAGSTTGQPVSLGDKARKIKKIYVGKPHVAVYYTPIEYIESTGTQYINTRYNPNQNVGIEIDFTMLSMSGSYVSPFGAGSANTNRFSANNYSGFTGGEFYTGSTGHAAYMEVNVREQMTYKNKVFSDSKGHTYTTTNTFTCTEPLALFGCGTSTGAQWLSQTRIYSCKLYDGDTLIRDFIPVLDKNNVACLYDKITHEFYYNKGTGNFTAGTATGSPIYRDWGIVKRGFVGVNGVARLCFGSMRYAATVTLSEDHNAFSMVTSTEDYIIVAGGRLGGSATVKNTVSAVDIHGVVTNCPTMQTQRMNGGTIKVGEYGLVCGGVTGSDWANTTSIVEAYTNNLTKVSCDNMTNAAYESGSSWTDDKGIIGWGSTYISEGHAVDCYTDTLTHTRLADGTNAGRRGKSAATIDGNIVFCGSSNTSSAATDIYDENNVKSTVSSPYNRINAYPVGLTLKEHAVFFGGSYNNTSQTLCVAYDSSFVSTTFNAPAGLSQGRGFSSPGNKQVWVGYDKKENSWVYDDTLVLEDVLDVPNNPGYNNQIESSSNDKFGLYKTSWSTTATIITF